MFDQNRDITLTPVESLAKPRRKSLEHGRLGGIQVLDSDVMISLEERNLVRRSVSGSAVTSSYFQARFLSSLQARHKAEKLVCVYVLPKPMDGHVHDRSLRSYKRTFLSRHGRGLRECL